MPNYRHVHTRKSNIISTKSLTLSLSSLLKSRTSPLTQLFLSGNFFVWNKFKLCMVVTYTLMILHECFSLLLHVMKGGNWLIFWLPQKLLHWWLLVFFLSEATGHLSNFNVYFKEKLFLPRLNFNEKNPSSVATEIYTNNLIRQAKDGTENQI